MPVQADTEEQGYTAGPIHGYFGLSYASYLVLPRSVLQSMTDEWQGQFVALLTGLSEHFGETLDRLKYNVQARDEAGRLAVDPLSDYRLAKHEPDVPFLPEEE